MAAQTRRTAGLGQYNGQFALLDGDFTYPDLTYAARVASLAQPISFPSLPLRRTVCELLQLLAMSIGLYGISLLLSLLMWVELIRLAWWSTMMVLLLLLCQEIMIAIVCSG
jgi:hypothetical protein